MGEKLKQWTNLFPKFPYFHLIKIITSKKKNYTNSKKLKMEKENLLNYSFKRREGKKKSFSSAGIARLFTAPLFWLVKSILIFFSFFFFLLIFHSQSHLYNTSRERKLQIKKRREREREFLVSEMKFWFLFEKFRDPILQRYTTMQCIFDSWSQFLPKLCKFYFFLFFFNGISTNIFSFSFFCFVSLCAFDHLL